MSSDKKMIMLVEDDPDHEALTVRALRHSHVANEIVVARDGAEALALLLGDGRSGQSQSRTIPEVIVLDLNLPKIDGFEVLRQLRDDERTALVPVVVLTSSDEERDVVSSYRLGANSYVRKPVDFLEFQEATRQLGLYWLVVNHGPPGRGGIAT